MSIEIQQTVRSKRKTLALIVKPDGSLLVRAPLHTPVTTIQEFVEKNERWIQRKRAEFQAALPSTPKQYLPDECFLYLGNSYALEIVEGQRSPLLLDGRFKLAARLQVQGALVFEKWYREQARIILTQRVELLADPYGFQYTGLRITAARSRWGSCSATGSLNFTWRLVMAPLEVIDYVVVHELVHTVIHNHSKRFWKRVEKIMPDYAEHRKWLKKNGQELML